MKSSIRSFINPRVLAVPEYDQKHVTMCWRNEGYRRFMSNESSYVPMKAVQASIQQISAKVNYYAEDAAYAFGLREKIAEYVGVKAENITLGNGSMELLDLMFLTFISNHGVDQVVMPAPDYSAYPIRANLFGGVVTKVVVGEDIEAFIPGALAKVTTDTKLILFSRPNNPVGKLLPKNAVFELLKKEVVVVVDEAYIEMAEEGASMASLVNDFKNLVVLRTFSKGFGLAGLRLGYVLANQAIIKYINMARHIFNVNLVAMVAGEAVMDNLALADEAIQEQKRTRDWLFSELQKIPGFRPLPSQANFIFVDVLESGYKASEYVDLLLEHGFSVRDFSKKEGLDKDRYFRITVGYPEDIRHLVDFLKAGF